MKKICLVLLTLILCFPFTVNAKTLNQLLAEAEANRAAYAEASKEKELTEAEKNQATKEKAEVEAQISSINNEMEQIEKDIDNTKSQIEKKDKEIKEIMKFVQVSEGSSTYLEYIFGASSFTDFIYRVSVAEQLADYNDTLIAEYNENVKELDEKQTALNKKSTELSQKEQELSILEAKLNEEIESISEGMQSKDDEYKTQINMINNMKKMGCKGTEDLSTCQARIAASTPVNPSGGSITAPNAYGTYMPIAQGYLTSDYGPRTGEFHTGMDFATGYVTNVYPVAAGKVINIDYPSYPGACGNHKVYILHNIKGVTYTTSYWHLTGVSVSVGQTVSANTKIGTIGGRGYVDACASGGHVHLNLFNGYTTTNSGRINPRIIIPQAPKEYVYFSTR